MPSHEEPMATPLSRITTRARQEPTATFDNVWYVMTVEFLANCFHALRPDAASGVDGVTYATYAEDLEAHLQDLVERLQTFRYHPQPVRRVYIPKAGGGQRPLGIPALEDKIVQEGMRRILAAIVEGDFLDCSYGFRPGRGCHTALEALESTLVRHPVHYVIDADIQGVFDSVPHDKLLQCVRQRVTDRRFLRYLVRFLKAGVMELGGRQPVTETGVPQGGLISPVLANRYLHYALDVWFMQQVRPTLRGYAALNRYADDFVRCIQYETDATRLLALLRERLTRCGLTLAEEKTHVLLFSRFAADRAARSRYPAGTFDYLGFTHYWTAGTPTRGARMGRKTSRKRFRQKVRQLKEWLQRARYQMDLPTLWRRLFQKMQGHVAYFGVPGNHYAVKRFVEQAKKLAFTWLNRCSQRRRWTRATFGAYLQRYPLPRARCKRQWAVLTG